MRTIGNTPYWQQNTLFRGRGAPALQERRPLRDACRASEGGRVAALQGAIAHESARCGLHEGA